LITQRAIRRGSFRTVRELVHRIDTFVARYNRTATAESILTKVACIAQAINGTSH
jgi:putative transposase